MARYCESSGGYLAGGVALPILAVIGSAACFYFLGGPIAAIIAWPLLVLGIVIGLAMLFRGLVLLLLPRVVEIGGSNSRSSVGLSSSSLWH